MSPAVVVTLSLILPILVLMGLIAVRRANARARGEDPDSLPPLLQSVPWFGLATVVFLVVVVGTMATLFYGGERSSEPTLPGNAWKNQAEEAASEDAGAQRTQPGLDRGLALPQ
ncbi:MAG: hypothetical protein ACPGOY_10890 [Rhodospirillaceae bacterium]